MGTPIGETTARYVELNGETSHSPKWEAYKDNGAGALPCRQRQPDPAMQGGAARWRDAGAEPRGNQRWAQQSPPVLIPVSHGHKLR